MPVLSAGGDKTSKFISAWVLECNGMVVIYETFMYYALGDIPFNQSKLHIY